jgi:hypothetical protein
VRQLRLQPEGHVVRTAVDGARAADDADVLHRNARQLSVDHRVRLGECRSGGQPGMVGRAVGHAQRLEDALLDEVLPREAGQRRDQLPRDHVHQVVVVVAGAEARRRLEVAQSVDDLGAGEVRGRIEHQVARAQAQAAAVRQQVAHRELARHVGVAELELRQVVDHLVVPRQLALIHQDRERGRREGLGVRADLEHGVHVHRRRRAQRAHPVALGEAHLAVLDDRDRHAGDGERLHGACHRVVDRRGRDRPAHAGRGAGGRGGRERRKTERGDAGDGKRME